MMQDRPIPTLVPKRPCIPTVCQQWLGGFLHLPCALPIASYVLATRGFKCPGASGQGCVPRAGNSGLSQRGAANLCHAPELL